MANQSKKLFLNINWHFNKRSHITTCTNQGQLIKDRRLSNCVCIHYISRPAHIGTDYFVLRKYTEMAIKTADHQPVLTWISFSFHGNRTVTCDRGLDKISWPFHLLSSQMELTETWKAESKRILLESWISGWLREDEETQTTGEVSVYRHWNTWNNNYARENQKLNWCSSSPHLFQFFRRTMRCCFPVRVERFFCGLRNVIPLSHRHVARLSLRVHFWWTLTWDTFDKRLIWILKSYPHTKWLFLHFKLNKETGEIIVGSVLEYPEGTDAFSLGRSDSSGSRSSAAGTVRKAKSDRSSGPCLSAHRQINTGTHLRAGV